MKRQYYYVQTDVPLDIDGNPIGPDAPNMEESVVSGALLHLFFGSRFLIEENGFVRNVAEGFETVDIPLQDSVKFHPKHSYKNLLYLVYIRTLFEKHPELALQEEKVFCLHGTGFLSKQKFSFAAEMGRIKLLQS